MNTNTTREPRLTTPRPHLALAVMACLLSLCASPTLHAGFFGRFNLSSYTWLPSDPVIDSRSSLTGRFRFGWENQDASGLRFLVNLRIRNELAESEGLDRLTVYDLRLDYGLDSRPLAGSLGLCRMSEVSGLGDILGAQLQTNLGDKLSCGLFGGANPAVRDGLTTIDGSRYGAYLRLGLDTMRSLGVGYVATAGTEYAWDIRDLVVFDARWIAGRRFSTYHFGEVLVSSDTGDPSGLQYYYGTIRVRPFDALTLGVSYNFYNRRPYMPFKEDILQSNDAFPTEVPETSLKTNAVSPRIDLRLGRFWRVYVRFRRRDSDYHDQPWNQWLAGFSCSNFFHSGISLHANFNTTDRGDNGAQQSAYVAINRDLGRRLNAGLTYALSKNTYPESIFVVRHLDRTHRVGLTLDYLLSRRLSFLLDYESSFGDRDEDQQLLLNVRYTIR
jgi:hypothetical protein